MVSWKVIPSTVSEPLLGTTKSLNFLSSSQTPSVLPEMKLSPNSGFSSHSRSLLTLPELGVLVNAPMVEYLMIASSVVVSLLIGMKGPCSLAYCTP